MNILHLICQGLGNPLTIRYLENIRKQYKPNIMFLEETKNNVEYVQNIDVKLNYAHCFALSGYMAYWRSWVFFGMGM